MEGVSQGQDIKDGLDPGCLFLPQHMHQLCVFGVRTRPPLLRILLCTREQWKLGPFHRDKEENTMFHLPAPNT